MQKMKTNARELPRPTVGECQELFDRYGIDSSQHNGTTTDLCAIIKRIEDKVGKHRVELMMDDGYSVGV